MPARRSNPKMLHRAWELRKEMTPPEKRLWLYLRGLSEQGIRFRRQHAIGDYITDFCAPRQRLVIEVDGSQHLEQQDRDDERTASLRAQGYRVIRFWNDQIMKDMQGVARAILDALGEQ